MAPPFRGGMVLLVWLRSRYPRDTSQQADVTEKNKQDNEHNRKELMQTKGDLLLGRWVESC